ncbi:MAG: PAS domain-containing protein [Steroidobacteraceae bacterium]
MLLERLARYGDALEAIEATNALNVQLRQDIAVAFNNLLKCRLLVSMRRLQAAESTCTSASAVMTRAGRIDQRSIVEGELARIELARGRPAAAVARLDRVLDADRDRVPPKVLPRLYKYRADALAAAGRYEAAWRDQQRVAQLTDALNPIRQSIGVAEVSERLNTEMVRREQERLAGQLEHARHDALDHARMHRLYLALEIAGGLLLLALALLLWVRARHERAQRVAMRQIETQARVIATMREGVVLLDAAGRIQYANPSFQRLFGKSPDELAALSLEQLGIDAGAAPVSDAASPGAPAPVECHLRDAGGRQLTVLLTRSTVPLAGQPLQVCILQDVTELRRLERQIHSANSAEMGRLGSAMHDGIAQDLTGISLLLRTVAGAGAADAEQLARISAHVRGVIAHARTLARGLSPVQAAGGSLPAALSHCAEELGEKRGIDVRCRIELAALEPRAVQSDQIYRIASEALQWVSDAAECGRVDLGLRPRGEELLLEVRGDGAAAANATQPDTVTYLARLLGARTESASPAGAGRSFRLLVPLKSLGGGEEPRALTAASSAHAGGQISSAPPPS